MSQIAIQGNVIDKQTNLPVEGSTVTLLPNNISSISDESGRFSFKGKYDSSTTIMINTIGYASQIFSGSNLRTTSIFYIITKHILL